MWTRAVLVGFIQLKNIFFVTAKITKHCFYGRADTVIFNIKQTLKKMSLRCYSTCKEHCS